MPSLWDIGKTAKDKPWEHIQEETKKEIMENVEEYRLVFEEEMQKEVPRHPYKVMMEIRKEKDLYAGNCYRDPELIRALEILKDEYKKEWEELANGG